MQRTHAQSHGAMARTPQLRFASAAVLWKKMCIHKIYTEMNVVQSDVIIYITQCACIYILTRNLIKLFF